MHLQYKSTFRGTFETFARYSAVLGPLRVSTTVFISTARASRHFEPPGGGGCGLGRGVGVLGGPRAGVDGLCRLCYGVAVGGPFAGGRSSVF